MAIQTIAPSVWDALPPVASSFSEELGFFSQMSALEKRLETMKMQSKISKPPVPHEDLSNEAPRSRFASKESVGAPRSFSKPPVPHEEHVATWVEKALKNDLSNEAPRGRFASKESVEAPRSRFTSKESVQALWKESASRSRSASKESASPRPLERGPERAASKYAANETMPRGRFFSKESVQTVLEQLPEEAPRSRFASKESLPIFSSQELADSEGSPQRSRLASKESVRSDRFLHGTEYSSEVDEERIASRLMTKESVNTAIHPQQHSQTDFGNRLVTKESVNSAIHPHQESIDRFPLAYAHTDFENKQPVQNRSRSASGTSDDAHGDHVQNRSRSASATSSEQRHGDDAHGLHSRARGSSHASSLSSASHFRPGGLSLVGEEVVPDLKNELLLENQELRIENEELIVENDELRRQLNMEFGSRIRSGMNSQPTREWIDKAKEESENAVGVWIRRHKDRLISAASVKSEGSFRSQLFAQRRALLASKQPQPVAKSLSMSKQNFHAGYHGTVGESDGLLEVESADLVSFWNFPEPTDRALFLPKRCTKAQLREWQFEWPAPRVK